MDSKYRDHAVEPSPYIQKLLEELPGEQPTDWSREALACVATSFDVFLEDANNFWEALIEAMGTQRSPGRAKLEQEQIDILRSRFIPVDRSLGVMRRIFLISAETRSLFGKKHEKRSFQEMWKTGFKGREEFKSYDALRKWLWRKTADGISKEKDYNGKPERKAKVKANRALKEDERERKRLAYWKKKGMTPPAKQLPLFHDAHVILQVHEMEVSTQTVVEDEAPNEGKKASP
jgi:hypothetical protein